jgi:hypothetical protein
MKEEFRFLGMDVHAETIAAAMAEADGEVRSLGTIPNRMESVRKLIKLLGHSDAICFSHFEKLSFSAACLGLSRCRKPRFRDNYNFRTKCIRGRRLFRELKPFGATGNPATACQTGSAREMKERSARDTIGPATPD